MQVCSGGQERKTVHQSPSFEIEILAVSSLRDSVYQPFLKVSGQNSLIVYIFVLCNIEQFAPDGFSLILYNVLAHSMTSRYFSSVADTLRILA